MASSGNFCVFSTVFRPKSPYSTSDQITNGGLSVKGPSTGSFEPCVATFTPSSGKWYWEYRAGQGGSSSYGRPSIAVSEQTGVTKNEDYFGGNSSITGVLFVVNDGQKRINGTDSSYGTAVSQHDIVQMALDCDNGAMYFGINNTWQNSGDPTSGASKTGAALSTGIQNVPIDIIHTRYAGGGIDQYNFGQDGSFAGAITDAGNADGNGHGTFKYSPPSGYLSLCSANLPISDDIDPGGDDGETENPTKHFNVVTYTGNAVTGQSITGLGFKPDLIWAKMSSSSQNNQLYDSSRLNDRGTPTPFMLRSDTTGTQADDQTEGNGNPIIASFDNDGFTLGTSGSGPNDSGRTYVAWCWKANGGTTSTNTSGTANSTVQANTKAGFSISLTDNYTAANGVTIGHGLGKKPAFYIHKPTGNNSSGGASQAFNWHVYHHSLGATKALFLNLNNAAATAIGYWNNTEPTSTVLSLGNLIAGNGQSLVYAWSEIEGYSKFGSYTGNGNADGTFIYTGFRPRMIFIKRSSTTGGWWIFDTARDTFNVVDKYVGWHSNGAESSGSDFDFLANGFKLRTSDGDFNGSGTTIVYGAWADVPFKYANTF